MSTCDNGESLAIVVNAELLTLCEPGYFFNTPKIATTHKNLYWWLHCYPNGFTFTEGGSFSVFLYTSIGGFEAELSFTINQSDVEISKVYFFDEPMQFGVPQLATHENLRSGVIIQDGEFTIRCWIKFKLTSQTIREFPNVIKDSCVIKFHQNALEMCNSGQNILTPKQTINGIRWYNDFYPCGYENKDDGYINTLLNIEGELVSLQILFALSIGGIPVYKTFYHTPEEKLTNDTSVCRLKLFSHELCKRADHKNGVIELTCTIIFTKPQPYTFHRAITSYLRHNGLLDEAPSTKKSKLANATNSGKSMPTTAKNLQTFAWKESENIIMNADLLRLEPGQYFESVKKSTPCKDLFWWIRCYPNGRFEADKGQVGVFIYTSIDGFEISYTLTVDGSHVKMQHDYFIYENLDPLNHGSSRLISHKKVKSDRLIKNGIIGIGCQVTFKLPDEILNIGPGTKNAIVEDTCVVKLDRKAIELGKWINNEIQNGSKTLEIKWSVKCCPYGEKFQDEAYVSVGFHVESLRAIKKLETSCALSIGGVLIHKSGFPTNDDIEYTFNFPKLLSHKQCLLADHKHDIIDLVCKVKYSTPASEIPKELSAYEFEDSETLVINADWLDLFEPGNCFASSRRRVLRCKDLYWWIKCYPNGENQKYKQNISVFLWTSAGGFKLTQSATVLRSNVDRRCTKSRSKGGGHGWSDVISHEELRQGDTIKNDVFVIKCEAIFNIPMKTRETLKMLETFEDIHTIKFNLQLLETYKPGQVVIEENQTIGDIAWLVEYYPCGVTEDEKGYISVFFILSGGPITVEYSCAISVEGFLVQQSDFHEFKEARGWKKCFPHKLCKLADHRANIIDIVCKVRFSRMRAELMS